jgi:DNA-directed RNA polymerase specialized sigma subunit
MVAGFFLSAWVIMMAHDDFSRNKNADQPGEKSTGVRRASEKEQPVSASSGEAARAPLTIGAPGAIMSGSPYPIQEIVNSGKILEPRRLGPLIDQLIDDPELIVFARAACLTYKNWFDQYCHALSYKAYTSERLEHDQILSAGEKIQMFLARLEDHYKENRANQAVLAFLFNELSHRARAIIAMDPGTVTAREATLLVRESIAGMRGALTLFQYIIGYDENGEDESRFTMLDGGYFVEGGFVQRSFFQSIDPAKGHDPRLSYTKKDTEAVKRVLGVDLKQTDNPYHELGQRGLTKQEEKELFRLYRLENNGLAHWVIVEMTRNYFYQRIKGYVAMHYHAADDLEDIMQQAAEGILAGMQNFKVSKGFYFRSYVWTLIKNKILEYLWSQETTVSVSRDMRQTQRVLTLSKRLFYTENKRWPRSYEELIAFDPSLEITKKQYEDVEFADGLTVSSLDRPIAKASGRSGKEQYYIDHLQGFSFAREQFELFESIEKAYAIFKDRYFTAQKKNAARNWDMLVRRGIYSFGSAARNPFLRVKEAESLESIGDDYGLSKEGVSKITTPMAADIKDIVRRIAPGLDNAAIDAFFPRASRAVDSADPLQEHIETLRLLFEKEYHSDERLIKHVRALVSQVPREQRLFFARGLLELAKVAEENKQWPEYEKTLEVVTRLAKEPIDTVLIVGADSAYYACVLALMGKRITVVDWSAQRLGALRRFADDVRVRVEAQAPNGLFDMTYIPTIINNIYLPRFGLDKGAYDLFTFFAASVTAPLRSATPREWLRTAAEALKGRGYILCSQEDIEVKAEVEGQEEVKVEAEFEGEIPPHLKEFFPVATVVASGIKVYEPEEERASVLYAVEQNAAGADDPRGQRGSGTFELLPVLTLLVGSPFFAAGHTGLVAVSVTGLFFSYLFLRILDANGFLKRAGLQQRARRENGFQRFRTYVRDKGPYDLYTVQAARQIMVSNTDTTAQTQTNISGNEFFMYHPNIDREYHEDAVGSFDMRAVVDAWEDSHYDAALCARYVSRHKNMFRFIAENGICRADRIIDILDRVRAIAEGENDTQMLARLSSAPFYEGLTTAGLNGSSRNMYAIREILEYAAAEGIDAFHTEQEPRLADIIERTVGTGGLVDVGCGNNLFVSAVDQARSIDPAFGRLVTSLHGIDRSNIRHEVLLSGDNFSVQRYETVGDDFVSGSEDLILTFNAPYPVDFPVYFSRDAYLLQHAGLVMVRLHEVDASLGAYYDIVARLQASGFVHVAIVSDIKGYPPTTDTEITPIVIAWREDRFIAAPQTAGTENDTRARGASFRVQDESVSEPVPIPIHNAEKTLPLARSLARAEHALALSEHKDLEIIVDFTQVGHNDLNSPELIADYLRGKNVGDYRVTCIVDTAESIAQPFFSDLKQLLGTERLRIIRRESQHDFAYYANRLIARGDQKESAFVVIANTVAAIEGVSPRAAAVRRVSLHALASPAEYCRLGIMMAFMDGLLAEKRDSSANVYFVFDSARALPAMFEAGSETERFAGGFITALISELHTLRREKIVHIAA